MSNDTENLTDEESDVKILEEMGIAEDDSTINDTDDSQDDSNDSDEDDSEEEVIDDSEDENEGDEPEEESDEDGEDESDDNSEKKPKGFAKILQQRNEARNLQEAEKTRADELQAKLDQMEKDGEYGNEEYIKTLVDKGMAEREEVTDFFDDNPELRKHKKGISTIMRENSLNLENATSLFLAQNDPELLLEPQTRNKKKSKSFNIPTQPRKDFKSNKPKFTDDEFERMAKSGKIKF